MREAFSVSRNDGGVALLEMPPQVCEIGPGAFFEQSASLEAQLQRSEERLVRELVSVLDKVLLDALSARSLPEFEKIRSKVWPRYIRSVRALSDTMGNLMSREARESTVKTAIASLDTDFQRHEERFGDLLTEQAIFTIWTIGRMRSLGREIAAAGNPPRDKRQADSALLSEYSVTAYWSSFHLDLMVAAMKFGRPLPEELREAVCEGLRAAVNAYTIMKEALLLRCPRIEEAPTEAFVWDEEDQELLASSMRDLNVDLSNDGNNAR